jgi:Cu+-exporting ATPase
MKSAVYEVKGMSCASCAVRIQKTVKNLTGVDTADINYATEKLSLSYDEAKLDQATLTDSVKKIGYELVAEEAAPDVRQAIIPIAGMTCAACSTRIEKKLNSLPGVERASVNLATEKADVAFRPNAIRLLAIKDAITALGYTPLEESESDAEDEHQKRKDRETKSLKRSFLLSLFVTLPLLYLAMAPMISFVRLPFPAFLAPMEYPFVYALVMLALTVPAVVAGRKFYTRGFSSLVRLSPNMDSLIAVGTAPLFDRENLARGL